MQISPYAVFTTNLKKGIKRGIFFIGTTKGFQKFQYQQSYVNYRSYIELQN